METLEAIYKRRSIREYTEEAVSRADLEILLRAAFSAPTAANGQPWEFVVIDEKDILDKVRRNFVFARYEAPAAIVLRLPQSNRCQFVLLPLFSCLYKRIKQEIIRLYIVIFSLFVF